MATLWLGVKHKEILPFGKKYYRWVSIEILPLGKRRKKLHQSEPSSAIAQFRPTPPGAENEISL